MYSHNFTGPSRKSDFVLMLERISITTSVSKIAMVFKRRARYFISVYPLLGSYYKPEITNE